MTLACFKVYDIRGRLGEVLSVEIRGDALVTLGHVRAPVALIRDAG